MARNLIDALGASSQQMQQILEAVESPDQCSVAQIGNAIPVGLEIPSFRGEIPNWIARRYLARYIVNGQLSWAHGHSAETYRVMQAPEERPNLMEADAELDTIVTRLRVAHGDAAFAPDAIVAACDGIITIPADDEASPPVIVRAVMYELLRTKRITIPASVSDELYLVA